MNASRGLDHAVQTAEEFVAHLDKMVDTYNPEANVRMRWVIKDRGVVLGLLNRLRSLRSFTDIDALWAEAQEMPRLLGTSLRDSFAMRYSELQSRLYREIVDLVGEMRRTRENETIRGPIDNNP